MNFPSVSLFSSTANADLSKFFKKLMREFHQRIQHHRQHAAGGFAVSVKYALYSETPADTGLLTPMEVEDHTYLYRNEFTLPLGVMVPYDLEDNWQLDITNPADVQNDLAVVLGARPVLEEVPSETLRNQLYLYTGGIGRLLCLREQQEGRKGSALMGGKYEELRQREPRIHAGADGFPQARK